MKFFVRLFSIFTLSFVATQNISAQATYRFTGVSGWEDSVRIGIVVNQPTGGGCNLNPAAGITDCATSQQVAFGLGHIEDSMQTLVLKALDTSNTSGRSFIRSKNVRVVLADNNFNYNTVLNMWPGKKPHAIVHIQAGWHTCNGFGVAAALNRAASDSIGIVSYGDDAAHFADQFFGFTAVANSAPPMNAGTTANSLWIDLTDDSLILAPPGITRNALRLLNGAKRLTYKPFNVQNGRCNVDADFYSVTPAFAAKIQHLGNQSGTVGATDVSHPYNDPNSFYRVVSSFQDSARRAVALAFEPHFLAERNATEQLTYDAIIYASFAKESLKKVVIAATPRGQAFTSPQISVSLDGVPSTGLRIFYTTNGTAPDSARGALRYTGPLTLTNSTTIKAIGYSPGYKPSDTLIEIYTKVSTTPTLLVLDGNGNPLTNGYLTELNTNYLVRLSTNEALTTTSVTARTLGKGDNETISLANPTNTGSLLVFNGTMDLSLIGASIANRTDANFYDTLLVKWTNPNKASDTISVRVPIRPSPKQATATFSATPGLPGTNVFVGTENPIYIVVVDQPLPTGMLPINMVVTASPSDLSGNTTANVTLTPTCLGMVCTYTGTINIGPGAGQLFISNSAATLNATYKDPLDGDQATASAGYGTPAEIPGLLVFTDNGGVVWPGGNYSPSNGFLNLRYSDDRAATPANDSKSVNLTIVNKLSNGTLGLNDTESVTVTLVLTSSNTTTGVWEGKINLADLPNPTPKNMTAETYILGNVTAVITTHSYNNTPNGSATANINVAWPDKPGDINVVDGTDTNKVIITRGTDGIIIRVNDQSLSTGKDTLFVSVRCGATGDVLGVVRLIEQVPPGGIYVSDFIPKDEGVTNITDSKLSCASTDIITVRLVDPVYGIVVTKDVPIVDTTSTVLSYANRAGATVTQITEGSDSTFVVMVRGSTPSVLTVDTVNVTLSVVNNSGVEIDKEIVRAIETGPNTNEFRVEVPFKFVNTGVNPSYGNGQIEGKLTASSVNSVTVKGSVTVAGKSASADLILYSALVKAVTAYIKDLDLNGTPDHVYVIFSSALPFAATSLSTQWPAFNSAPATASGAKVTLVPGSNNALVADYTPSILSWDKQTGITAGTPLASLPNDRIFGGLGVPVEDSLGPMILTATKRIPSETQVSPIDTLVLTLSEPIISGSDLIKSLKIAQQCGDCYSQAVELVLFSTPQLSSDKKTLLVLIDNTKTALNANSRTFVYLNRDPGHVTDLLGNIPIPKGVEIKGENRKVVIRDLTGYPPVAGLRPGDGKRFDIINPGNFNVTNGDVGWIPPADWTGTVGSYNGRRDITGISDTNKTDPFRVIERIPNNVSLVQVISAGRYIAHVSIYNNHGLFMQSFSQAFGYRQEMANNLRKTKPGALKSGWYSYLVWDMKDSKGQKAGQGVYVWKITFHFQDTHKQEVFYTRTGIVRSSDLAGTP